MFDYRFCFGKFVCVLYSCVFSVAIAVFLRLVFEADVGGEGGRRRILKMSIKSCWTGERQTTGQEDAGMDSN